MEAGLGSTSIVGLFPASQSQDFGLHDAGGNVWEWCADEIGERKKASLRVLRGGGWDFEAADCRSAYRGRLEPDFRYDYLGFRVALVPVQG
jgi:formylglycine-generating enzyme required for sulfatase activity